MNSARPNQSDRFGFKGGLKKIANSAPTEIMRMIRKKHVPGKM